MTRPFHRPVTLSLRSPAAARWPRGGWPRVSAAAVWLTLVGWGAVAHAAPTTEEGEAASAAPASMDAPATPPGSAATATDAAQDEGPAADAADAGAPAPAEAAAPTARATAEPAPAAPAAKKSLSHRKLGYVSVAPGWGFNLAIPFDDGKYCGQFSTDDEGDGRRGLCTDARNWFLGVALGYGLGKRVDVQVEARFGLTMRDFRCKDESDPASCRGLFVDKVAIGVFPGVRLWGGDPEAKFKVGGAIDFVYLYENFAGYRERGLCSGPGDTVNGPCPNAEDPKIPEEADVGDHDVGFRGGPIFQLDPHHNVGIFLQPAIRMTFLRWFEAAPEVNLGIQARFP